MMETQSVEGKKKTCRANYFGSKDNGKGPPQPTNRPQKNNQSIGERGLKVEERLITCFFYSQRGDSPTQIGYFGFATLEKENGPPPKSIRKKRPRPQKRGGRNPAEGKNLSCSQRITSRGKGPPTHPPENQKKLGIERLKVNSSL